MAGPTGNAHQFLKNLALCDGLAGRKTNNRPHTLRPNVRSKAAQPTLNADFRFTPERGHGSVHAGSPVSANRRHPLFTQCHSRTLYSRGFKCLVLRLFVARKMALFRTRSRFNRATLLMVTAAISAALALSAVI